jgi:hypothetical protein
METIMSIDKGVALVASVIGLAVSPLAAGHGPLKFGTSAAPLTESQMQATASEAPAWHAGDGSVYDSSEGRVIAPAPPMVASNAPASPETSTATTSSHNSKQARVPSDVTTTERDVPAPVVSSARQTANPGRYSYRPK